MKLETIVDTLEREMLAGRARWIADLNESFRDVPIGGHTFDLVIRGQTRSSGFMLSRFFAWTVLPNYGVSLFVKAVRDRTDFGRARMAEFARIVAHDVEERNGKWGWLVFFFESDPSDQVTSFIQEYDRNEMGIGAFGLTSGKMTVSNNLLGRSLLRHLRFDKLVEHLENSQNPAS